MVSSMLKVKVLEIWFWPNFDLVRIILIFLHYLLTMTSPRPSEVSDGLMSAIIMLTTLWRWRFENDNVAGLHIWPVIRLEICHDRRERRSCKIFPSCVNFSRKQHGSLSNLHRNMKFTQLFGNFTHISLKTIEIIHIYFNFNKRDHQCSHKRCFIVAKKSRIISAFSV